MFQWIPISFRVKICQTLMISLVYLLPLSLVVTLFPSHINVFAVLGLLNRSRCFSLRAFAHGMASTWNLLSVNVQWLPPLLYIPKWHLLKTIYVSSVKHSDSQVLKVLFHLELLSNIDYIPVLYNISL